MITQYLPYAGLSLAAVVMILQAVIRLVALLAVLRDTQPSDRPAIIRALSDLFWGRRRGRDPDEEGLNR